VTLTLANRYKTRWTFIALLALAAAAIAISFLIADGAGNRVDAQEQQLRCDDDEFGLLCLRKDSGGTPGTFRFEIERDDVNPTIVLPCGILGSAKENESDFTEVLSGGSQIAIPFDCSIRVTEVPQSGWDLRDIRCDYDNEIYEVRYERNSVLIEANPGSLDGDINARFGITCTFVNQAQRSQLNLGGLFAGQPTALPTAPAPAAVAPAAQAPSISPPRTGDAGLK